MHRDVQTKHGVELLSGRETSDAAQSFTVSSSTPVHMENSTCQYIFPSLEICTACFFLLLSLVLQMEVKNEIKSQNYEILNYKCEFKSPNYEIQRPNYDREKHKLLFCQYFDFFLMCFLMFNEFQCYNVSCQL